MATTGTKVKIVLLIVVIVSAATIKTYYIRNDSGQELLWSTGEAYLFINVHRRGIRVSYLEYPWLIFKEWLGGFAAVRPPDDELSFVVVIHVTPSAVERHVVIVPDTAPGAAPGFYTPLEGHIYANYPGLGGLCRWADDHFERATEEERNRLGGINHLTLVDFDNDGGWSRRGVGGGVGYEFTAEVAGNFSLVVKNQAKDPREYPKISFDLLRSTQSPERIWYLDETPRGVSRSAYHQLLIRP